MALANAYLRLNVKWANKLGVPYSLFRPTGASTPLAPANQIQTLNALLDASLSLAFNAPNKFGNALFAAILNPKAVQPCDYLVGPEGTFFISSTEPLKPILAVQCNRVISFERPSSGSPGSRLYGGSTSEPIASLIPASVLTGTKGERNVSETLPDDSRMPWETILVPALPGMPMFQQADQFTDDIGRRFTVSAAELTGTTGE